MPEKRLSLLTLSPLLTLCIGAWILTTALSSTIGQPTQTKEMIHKSGLYQALVPSAVADAAKNNPTLAGLPLDNPKIQKLLGSSLDSVKVQREGDQAVDGIYTWLEGKSAQPKIGIDVAPDSSTLAQAVSAYAAALPTCAPGQDPGTDLNNNPLAARCVPAGVSPELIQNFAISQVAANPALTNIPPLTQDDLKLTSGKTIMQSFAWAPQFYHWALFVPLVSAVIGAICILLIIIMLRPIRGLRSVGKHFISVGVTLGVVAFLLAWATSKGLDVILPKTGNPNVGEALSKLTTLFNDAYRNNIIHLSIYVAVAGATLYAGALLAAFALKHRPIALPRHATTTGGGEISESLTAQSHRAHAAAKPHEKVPRKKTAAKKPPTRKKTTKKPAKS